MSPEFINKDKLKFIIFQKDHLENCEGKFTFKIIPTAYLALPFWLFWFCWVFRPHQVDIFFAF